MAIHIEFLVEEESAEKALHNLIPKILKEEITYKIHPFQGKRDLLKKLKKRLLGYGWIRNSQYSNYRIVVLIDLDRDNCIQLKRTLEISAQEAGFYTKSSATFDGRFRILNRIAVKELEAWFFGDFEAVISAFPKVSGNIPNQSRYRSSDAIANTWESLERVLKQAGYFPQGMPKIKTAKEISNFMEPERNNSPSFINFKTGLIALVKS